MENKCHICKESGRVTREFINEIIMDDESEVHLKGEIMDKNGKSIAVCKGCLSSLFYSAAKVYHDASLGVKDEEIIKH